MTQRTTSIRGTNRVVIFVRSFVGRLFAAEALDAQHADWHGECCAASSKRSWSNRFWSTRGRGAEAGDVFAGNQTDDAAQTAQPYYLSYAVTTQHR